MKKKILAGVLACILLIGIGVGGTLAWLTAESSDVVNTFTVGDINIVLDEADVDDTDGDGNKIERDNANTYHFVPGDTMSKDPQITVLKDSEACWLFVKVTEVNNVDVTGKDADGNDVTEKALIYSVDAYSEADNPNGWKPVPGHTGYWYREVGKVTAENGQPFYILKDNQVKASEYITKAQVETMGVSGSAIPNLTFEAAAIQKDNIATVEEAWAELAVTFTT